jgi:hypothetical protein
MQDVHVICGQALRAFQEIISGNRDLFGNCQKKKYTLLVPFIFAGKMYEKKVNVDRHPGMVLYLVNRYRKSAEK